MAFWKRNIDLILILAIGFALRFSISIIHSYTNDELSAINRLRYDNFSDLIDKGVKTGDMHPAGVQVFEKIWSSIFGTCELALRFPFVLFGTASIFLIFLIGWKWFNRQTGILAAILLSVLAFPVIQSELARPYSPGLFLALITAWFYHKVLFCEVKKWRNAIFLGLCFAAGMYTHYFLFLFLLFIGFTGLIFLRKENFKLYLVAALIAAIFYLPHIEITLYHLQAGGLGWLGKPDTNFLPEFIYFAFNESWITLLMIFILILASFIFPSKEQPFPTRYYTVCMIWFFGMYVVAHVWSVYSTPILKPAVMLFSFPFLLLMIAYLISSMRIKFIAPILLGLTGIATTFINQDLYGEKFMGFKNTSAHILNWYNQYGKENIYTVYNINNPNYLNYYANQTGDTIDFDQSVIEFGSSENIRKILKWRMEEFCIAGYAEKLTLPQIFEVALESYPNIVEYHRFENSAVFLLSREDSGELNPHSEIFSSLDLYELNTPSWKINPEFILTDTLKDRLVYELNENNLYGPEFTFKKQETEKLDPNYLKIKLKARCPHNGQLTVSFTAKRNGIPVQHNGEIFWMGYDLEPMLIDSRNVFNGEGESFWAFEIPEFIKAEDDITISLWNRNGNPIQITSFEIWLVENIWN